MICPNPRALLSCHPSLGSANSFLYRGLSTYTGGQDEGLCRVHRNGSDIVRMCFEGRDLFRCVVVVYRAIESRPSLNRSFVNLCFAVGSYLTPPATIQFFLAMKRPARTGTSVSSNVFTIDCEIYDQMWTCPACVSQISLVLSGSYAYHCTKS